MKRLTWRGWAAVVALGLTAAGWSGYRYFFHDPLPPVSAESGREFFFERDLGARYSTGLPYPLVLAALENYPDELGGSRAAFCEKYGILRWPGEPERLPVGFVLRRDRFLGVDLLMTNCSLCHAGIVDGEVTPGLGNRNIRLDALNGAILGISSRDDFNADELMDDCRRIAKERGLAWGWGAPKAVRTAIEVLRKQASEDKTASWGGVSGLDGGPGRSTPVEFGKSRSHVAVEAPYGYTKIPAIWSFGLRETFSCDGSIKGDPAMSLGAVEFNKGMTAEELLRRKPQWLSLYAYLQKMEAPSYPGEINQHLAEQGREVYSDNCARCHGEYDGDELDYQESVVPIEEIATDPDRLNAVTGALATARQSGPLAGAVRVEVSEGYVPPPLVGVWCRGPYLHNGSVPTLSDMLRMPEERPATFYVGGDTAYDLTRVGLYYEEVVADDGARSGKRASDKQFLFDTAKPANQRTGHLFGTGLDDDEKAALLEFLKTR